MSRERDEAVTSPEVEQSRPRGLRAVVTGTSWQTLAQFTPLVINLALTPYIIHGIGPTSYGVYLLATSVQTVLANFDGGVGQSANRYFSLYAGRDDRVAVTRLLGTLFVLTSALVVVTFALFYWASPWIIAAFPSTRADPEGALFLLRVLVAIIGIAQLRGLFHELLFAYHRFAITSSLTMIGHVIYVIGLVWSVQSGAGLRGIAWTLLLQQVSATLVIVPPAIRYLQRHALGFVGRPLLSEFFRYSWKVQLTGLMDAVAAQGDLLIVGGLAPQQTTTFGVGANFAQTLKNFPLNALVPMQTTVSRAIGASDPLAARAEIGKLQRLWVVAIVGWVAVGAPTAYFGVRDWLHLGSDLPGQVAAVALVGHGVWLLTLVQAIWCMSLGRPGFPLAYGIVSLVLNIGLTLGLIIPFGALGSSVATTVARIAAAIWFIWLLQCRLEPALEIPWRHVPWLAAVFSSVVAGLGAWGVSTFVVGHAIPVGPLALLACAAAGAPGMLLYVSRTIGFPELRRAAARVRTR